MKDLAQLNHRERLQIMKFVCAAVWADLEVSPSEKSFVLSLALRLGLPGRDIEQVTEWLERPPLPEEVDPGEIAPEHRRLLLEAIDRAVAADRVVDPPERESLRLLHELLEA